MDDPNRPNRAEVAQRLRQARLYLGLSQEEVAKATGIPRSAISLIESAQRGVEALQLSALAKLYQRPTDHFVAHEIVESTDEPTAHLARSIRDLLVPPGNRLEALKGDRKGRHSIRINDQWRICFRWDDGHAYDVEIVDYH